MKARPIRSLTLLLATLIALFSFPPAQAVEFGDAAVAVDSGYGEAINKTA